MKKILFIQNISDMGGIHNVNKGLINKLKEKYDIQVYILRNTKNISGKYEVNTKLINDKDIWNPILGDKIKECIREGKFFYAVKLLLKRFIYKLKLNKDYKRLKAEINNYAPDSIILSHYELLQAIPSKYLYKTNMHFHTTFGQVLINRDNIRIFNKYKKKIRRFIWLTEADCKQACEFGYTNSIYIYNSINSDKVCNKLDSKNCVFVGRFSKEKRIDLLIKIFTEVIEENNIHDWNLLIYGYGDSIKINDYKNNAYVKFCGKTDNVQDVYSNSEINLNTSSFEGFPVTVLEAMTCGVPTIIFNVGNNIYEVIDNDKTGYIVEDIDEYKSKLYNLICDFELRKKMSENCYLTINKFSIDNIIKKWEEIL